MTERILRNSARCIGCGEEIVSQHRHDFRSCRCGDLAVDGGNEYLRRAYKQDARWVDTSIVETGGRAMSIHPADRGIARAGFLVAVGLVERNAPRLVVREAASEALRTPTPDSIRALLMLGRGQPWFPSVIDAMAGVGIAAAEIVLTEPDHVARDGSEWTLQRDAGESDEDFELRRRLIEGGGRIAIRVEDLPDSFVERLRDGPRRWDLQHDICDLVDGMDVDRLERVLAVVQEIAR